MGLVKVILALEVPSVKDTNLPKEKGWKNKGGKA